MPSATLSGFLWTSRLSSLRPRRWFSPQDARRKTQDGRRQAVDRSSDKLDSARTCQICILRPVLGKKVPRTAAIGLLNAYLSPSEVGLAGITTSGDVVKRGFSAIVCPNLTTLCGIVVKIADIRTIRAIRNLPGSWSGVESFANSAQSDCNPRVGLDWRFSRRFR